MTLARASVNGVWTRSGLVVGVVQLILVGVVLVVFAGLDVRVRVAGVGGRGCESGDGLIALPRLAQEVFDVSRILGDRVRG